MDGYKSVSTYAIMHAAALLQGSNDMASEIYFQRRGIAAIKASPEVISLGTAFVKKYGSHAFGLLPDLHQDIIQDIFNGFGGKYGVEIETMGDQRKMVEDGVIRYGCI